MFFNDSAVRLAMTMPRCVLLEESAISAAVCWAASAPGAMLTFNGVERRLANFRPRPGEGFTA